jgi:DNA-binding transcriptional MerR regulator/effector-binding domain-containing protein
VYRIGDFSRIARVSSRLLRFYDEIGLLKPVHADPNTGYRFYSAKQLAELNRIIVLKDLGFSLEEIGPVLKNQLNAAELRGMLLMRRHDAERALASEAQKLRQIEMRIAQIETEGQLTDDVLVRVEPARRLLSLRRVVSSFGEARGLITLLKDQVRAIYRQGHAGQLVAVAHSQDFEADHIDVELGITLDANEAPDMPVDSLLSIRELPEARMAICVRVGLPEDAHLVTAKIGRFVEVNGDMLEGPSREVFLQPPRLDRMHEAIVEMQFPIRSRVS